MTHTTRCTVFLAGLALALTACAPPTYINIPPEDGDWAFSNPNSKDVRAMEAVAVRRSLEDDPVGGPYELVLPERTTPDTYAMVTHELGADAVIPSGVPAVELDERGKPVKRDKDVELVAEPVLLGEFPAVEVRSIRIRGAKGQVDIVRPSTSGRRLSTVYLEWEAGFGWYADRVRAWRVDPDAEPQPLGPAKRRATTAAE